MANISRLTLLLIVFLVAHFSALSQDLMRNTDLSQIKVDQISDADLFKYQQRLRSSGMTAEQAIQIAVSRGLPLAEADKLKKRLQDLNLGNAVNQKSGRDSLKTDSLSVRDSTDTLSRARKPLINPKIFGAELFNNASLTFEPNQKMATPLNYELGPGDKLDIAVFGVQETDFSLKVSNEGFIFIPNVGAIKVAGLTIEAATPQITTKMARTAYPSLSSGASKISVTLGYIRSIRVTIIGSNRPGNFTLSSLSTAFNALFESGGPLPVGSFREIELIRNNKVYRKIDLYRFLVNGDQSDNVGLKDNDVIRIPSYKKHIEIEGYVKRPGIFEVLPGESFAKMLEYASGFSDSAYRASVKVTQFTDKEFRVKDIKADSFPSYLPMEGDRFRVGKVLNRYANRVCIFGAIFRPGFYELQPGMTVADLIRGADGLKEDAYLARVQIIRRGSDLTREIVSFDAKAVLNGSTAIPLQREDSVVIKSIFDLRDDYYVTLQGEIRTPGTYEYSQQLTLKDVIVQAGGLTDAAYPQRIEVARLIRRDSLTQQDIRASEIIDVRGLDELGTTAKNVQIFPYDVISVRRKPGYVQLESVLVDGEMQYPGPYVLSKREERVSDLIKRAGGFSPEAFKEGAYLKRYEYDEEKRQLKRLKVEKLQKQFKDTTNTISEDIERDVDQIPLDIAKIMANPGSVEDVVLKGGDELHVPKYNGQVRISGNVLFPTQIPFNGEYSFRDYLRSAGGVAETGRKGKSYVLYANGKASAVRHFLFFKSYPRVLPGSEIIVPKKADKPAFNISQTIGIATAVASLVGVVIAVINVTR